jgi:small subunit ribosomal protein S17
MSLNEKTGIVMSVAGKQSVTVQVESLHPHAKFGKYLRHSKNFMVHDARNACGVGDRVTIRECRPLSARKRWRVIQILEKAKEVKAYDTDAHPA